MSAPRHHQEKKKEALYFIAIVPPEPAYQEALKLKHYFKDNHQTKAALNSPPHITLHMPFMWKLDKEAELMEKLGAFSKSRVAGEIQLANFGAFAPRVIFIQVLQNDWIETLQLDLKRFCKKELNLFNANYKEHAFHPHLTLAFRDLRKQKFYEAWESFKEKKFDAVFPVEDIVLLKHDGKVWQIFEKFKLVKE